ncbi:hypothetical protein M404DRAFT_999613 [Pisolithus tinctorius Marx 270]|uniref:Uncharacterized protein n=1 Tax=Pisolithus tinctorius Marx 270 TaxID=870435 RepID=A0A0C3PCY0_PISTI|nr:hypothetical protein M404DRAFT_999613 [Pisolithus tinctorius Marx 270]
MVSYEIIADHLTASTRTSAVTAGTTAIEILVLYGCADRAASATSTSGPERGL